MNIDMGYSFTLPCLGQDAGAGGVDGEGVGAGG